MDGEHVVEAQGRHVGHLDQLLAVATPGALLSVALAGVVDQGLAHGARRGAEEVRAVLEGPLRRPTQDRDPGLVDERRGLERMPGPLAPHRGAGEAPELLVQTLEQLVRGTVLLGPDLAQDLGDVASGHRLQRTSRAWHSGNP